MAENRLSIGKPAWEWESVDLQELVDNKIPEDLHLEYKESRLLAKTPQAAKDSCVQTLTKTVSAFNNADGGVIVIGIKEVTETGKNNPQGLDGGTDESQFGKTWLVQIINSNISPSISDLRVKSVKLDSEGEGKVAYVVWVPKGTRAVQARDLLYYQRVEDQSLPMRDFQIQDVNNRNVGPDLRLSFIIPQGQDSALAPIDGTDNTSPFRIAVVATNLSDTLAELGLFTIMVPQRLQPTQPTGFEKSNLQPKINLHYRGKDTSAYSMVFSKIYYAPESPPIFKQLHPTQIGTFFITLKSSYQSIPHYEPLLWIAESSMMQPSLGRKIIETNGHTIEFKDDPEANITLDDLDPSDYWKSQAPN